jgi:hypothetical protein
MTRQEYYNIREEFATLSMVKRFLQCTKDMMETYPFFKEWNMAEIKEFLDKRETELELNVEHKLGVI